MSEVSLEQFELDELLALIEGELPADQAAEVCRRLAGEPEIAALVQQMIADRALLSSAPTPVPPRDFLADIEQLLAKPMLMGSPPGAYRRRYRRQARRRRVRRFALAAGLLLAIGAGAWATFSQILLPALDQYRIARQAETADATVDAVDSLGTAESDAARLAAAPPTVDPSAGIVHHYPALWAPEDGSEPAQSVAGDTEAGDDRARHKMPAARKRVVAAEFALVLCSPDQASAEGTLVSVLSDNEAPMALTRNLTIEQSILLDDDARRAMARFGESEGAAGGSGVAAEIHLAGDRRLAPGLDRQIDYAERGATLTISVPAADLAELLESIAERCGGQSHLAPLPNEEGPASGAGSRAGDHARWFAQAAAARDAVRELERAGDGAIVLLPVRIETPSD
jgi:hypothetical protein